MKDNSQIINELFGFRKKSDLEKIREKLPTYTPTGSSNIPGVQLNQNGTVSVADPEELGKRLSSALGMQVGSHNIKSMSGKAVKRFPIIASDEISPETLVMLKNSMEEQYASYIQILVSNQVVDVTTLDSNDPDHNMAYQALSKIDSADFSKQSVANELQKGRASVDSIAKNIPIFPILRSYNESVLTDNSVIKTICENAIVDYTFNKENSIKTLLEVSYDRYKSDRSIFKNYNAGDISSIVKLGNARIPYSDVEKIFNVASIFNSMGKNPDDPRDYSPDFGGFTPEEWKSVQNLLKVKMAIYGYKNGVSTPEEKEEAFNDIYGKPNTDATKQIASFTALRDTYSSDIPTINNLLKSLADFLRTKIEVKEPPKEETPDDMGLFKDLGHTYGGDKSLSNCVNDAFKENDPLAQHIKRKFEEASYLLATYRISGAEYVSYLIDRLGIPVVDSIRQKIIFKYPSSSVQFKGYNLYDAVNTGAIKDKRVRKMQENVAGNKIINSPVIDYMGKILSTPSILAITAVSGGAAGLITAVATGALGGLGGAGAVAGAGIAAAIPIWGWAIIGASAITGLGLLIAKLVRNHKFKKYVQSNAGRIEGWERVEALIDELEKNKIKAVNISHELKKPGSILDKVDQLPDDNSLGLVFTPAVDATTFEYFDKKFAQIASTVKVDQDLLNSVNKFYSNPNNIKALNTSLNTKLMESSEQPRTLNGDILNFFNYLESYAETEEDLKSLTEAKTMFTISTKQAGQYLKPKTIEYKLNDKYASLVPTYGTAGLKVYGSAEYDRREIKDRKYNEPLIMTIRFNDKYADQKSVNSDLTAVIGILGVVNRIPSEEMINVLKSNIQDQTLKNYFGGDRPNSAKEFISDIFANVDKSPNALKISGKIWKDLEKVSHLASANALSGNNSGNVANAHLVFTRKEIDTVKHDTGVDYLKDAKLTAKLMKRYSAFEIVVVDDALQIIYIFNDPESVSWDAVPYSAFTGSSSKDQLSSALMQISRQI